MEDDFKMIGFYVLLIFAFLGIAFAISWTLAGFESRAYEQVTGKKVSQFNAMFLELRVEGC